MTSIRKSIAATFFGLALAVGLGFGVTELYASVTNDNGQDSPSVCPIDEQAAATCPVDKAATYPAEAAGA